jgi:hypothetical protein
VLFTISHLKVDVIGKKKKSSENFNLIYGFLKIFVFLYNFMKIIFVIGGHRQNLIV